MYKILNTPKNKVHFPNFIGQELNIPPVAYIDADVEEVFTIFTFQPQSELFKALEKKYGLAKMCRNVYTIEIKNKLSQHVNIHKSLRVIQFATGQFIFVNIDNGNRVLDAKEINDNMYSVRIVEIEIVKEKN